MAYLMLLCLLWLFTLLVQTKICFPLPNRSRPVERKTSGVPLPSSSPCFIMTIPIISSKSFYGEKGNISPQ